MSKIVLTSQAFRSIEKLCLPSIEACAECDPMSSVLGSLDDLLVLSEISLLKNDFGFQDLFPPQQHHYL